MKIPVNRAAPTAAKYPCRQNKSAADNESTAPLLFTRSLYKNYNFMSSGYKEFV